MSAASNRSPARSTAAEAALPFATLVLRNGSAPQVAEAIQQALGDASGPLSSLVSRRKNAATRSSSAARPRAWRRLSGSPRGSTNPAAPPRSPEYSRLNYADAESVTEVLRGVLGIDASASNPVAQSLQSGSRFGGGRQQPQPFRPPCKI